MQNIVNFYQQTNQKNIVFCCVDITDNACDNWASEIIKNQSDYTISNIYNKGYKVIQGKNEDKLLHESCKHYDYGLVFATGTEFINGDTCFKEFEKECLEDFFIKGHILDRQDAYYELHHQCYLINLKIYKKLGKPKIGKQILGSRHTQTNPYRSNKNIHDDYTPIWIEPGSVQRTFQHKCHGWNIIKTALDNNYSLKAFDNNIRQNKFYLYPEYEKDFYKHLNQVAYKECYCENEHIHTQNTEWQNQKINDLVQIVSPASGEWYLSCISKSDKVKIILYDYNEKSLKYWQENVTKLPNVDYIFLKTNLLHDWNTLSSYIDQNNQQNTLINLSNIFCYEGTCNFNNLKLRICAENQIINKLKNTVPYSWLNFASRSAAGFMPPTNLIKRCIDTDVIEIENLVKPTWHNNDWL